MLILASQSPRRRDMFDRLRIDYLAESADTDESIAESVTPDDYVKILAHRKGQAVLDSHTEDDYIISADTVVALGNTVYGKPRDFDDAYAMLKSFSGNTHKVYTGFAVFHGGKCYTEAVATEVVFRPLTDREICYYIEAEQPYDKAGAYGIQEMAGIFVKEIRGSFDNVVGLPLTAVEEALQREFGISLFDFAKSATVS
ncbi:MAG: septum formation protein Maf [Clostridia bacterium]|nr:septum formation protein Maf [Clostridia bacterium]